MAKLSAGSPVYADWRTPQSTSTHPGGVCANAATLAVQARRSNARSIEQGSCDMAHGWRSREIVQ